MNLSQLTRTQKIIVGVLGFLLLIAAILGIYFGFIKKDTTNKKPSTPTNKKPSTPTPSTPTTIFNNRKILPYGTYYISNGKNNDEAINSVITVSNTKLILETKYKNEEYIKKEFQFPLTLDNAESGLGGASAYAFQNINMGSYGINIHIKYYSEKPCIGITYYKKAGNKPEDYDQWLQSPDLDNPKPTGFKLPSK